MSGIYKGTLGLVGNTPLVEVTNIEKKLAEHPEKGDYLRIVYSFRAEFIRSTLRWMNTLADSI